MGSRSPVLLLAAAALAALLAAWSLSRTPAEHARVEPLGRSAPRAAGLRDPAGVRGEVLPADRAVDTDGAPLLEHALQSERVALHPASEEESELEIWVEGRVVLRPDAPRDERLLVEARAFPSSRGGPTRPRQARVGDDLCFRVAFPAGARRGWLTLRARYHYLAQPLEIDPSELAARGEQVQIEPELGGRIEGRVLPPDGASLHGLDLGGASVRLDQGRDLGRSARLDAAGGFAFDALRPAQAEALRESSAELDRRVVALPSRRSLALRVSLQGFAPARVDGIEVRRGETTQLEIRLELGVSLRGRVLGEDGSAIEGARVWVDVSGGTPSTPDLHACKSAADGSFELVGVRPGKVLLHAAQRGTLLARIDLGALDSGALREGLVLRLASGGVIEGSVHWPDGSPAIGADVTLIADARQGAPAGRLEGATKCDREGRFRFGGLTAERYRLRASARTEAGPGLASSTAPIWIGRAQELRPGGPPVAVLLGPGERVRGSVRDERGQPVPVFTIRADPVRGSGAGASSSQRFRSPSGDFELSGLSDGKWLLHARSLGHRSSTPVQVSIPWDGAPVELDLLRLASVRGRVLFADGEPAAGARVQCAGRTTLAQGDGSFTLGEIDPGRARVSAGFGMLQASEPVDLELGPGAAVSDLRLVLARKFARAPRSGADPGSGD